MNLFVGPRWLVVCFFALLTLTLTASAQDTASSHDSPVPPALAPSAVAALVQKLSPEQVEALGNLLTALGQTPADAAAVTGATAPGFAEVVDGWLAGFRDSLIFNVSHFPEMISGVAQSIGAVFSDRGGAGPVLLVLLALATVAGGLAAEWVYTHLTRSWRTRITHSTPQAFGEACRVLTSRLGLEVGALVVFIVAALSLNGTITSDENDRAIITSVLLSGIMIPRVAAAVLRFILAPKRRDLRLVSANDWTAAYLHRQFISVAVLVGVAFVVYGVMQHVTADVGGVFRFWAGLLVNVWLGYITWRARGGLTDIIKGDEEELTPGLERMAAWWPTVTIIVIAGNWLLLQFALSAGAGLSPGRTSLALALVITAPFLDTMVRGIASHLVPPMLGEGKVAERAHQGTRMCYVRVGRLLLIATLIITIGKLWGINLRNIADGAVGAQLAAQSVGFLLVIAVGYLAWEVLNLWVNRQLAKEMPADDGHAEGAEMGGAGGSRLATILPILHVALQVTVVTLTVLLALSQIGVNITPLLAGAGVFGLAIGFGAQALVKDIVSGVFFLLDDAFRIGEFIDVGGTMGSVEKISLRSLQLRGATGPVHIVPYGEMAKLTNLSRDWVIMKLRFTVPFDTDTEQVRKLFKKIGQKLLENPDYGGDFIEPFKSQGAAEITDVGIVIRGKFTAKPGTQFVIRKAIYLEVQRTFEENGIEFARREVRISMPSASAGAAASPDLSNPALQAAAAAVIADDAAQLETGSPAKPGDER